MISVLQSSTMDAYFAETHPLVRKRLMPVMLILIASVSLAAITGTFFTLQFSLGSMPEAAYWIQWFNNIAMALTAVALGFGAAQLHKNNIRQAITVLLGSCTVSVIAQVFANGGMGEASIIIYPLMIMVTGFFGNLVIMQRIKRLLAVSIVVLYLLGVFGVKPPDISAVDPIEVFMRMDQMIYCLFIIEVCFRSVKMFINDYGTILSQLNVEQQQLDYVANHDALTGLPNRYACEQHFDMLFRRSPPMSDTKQFLLFIDIDNFKNINTRFGHHGGDEAIQKVALCLKQMFAKHEGVVSRVGGDEFIAMLSMPAANVEARLNGMLLDLAKPLTVFGQKEYVTCSMGGVDIDTTKSSFKEEYRKADMALNRAKKTGKNRYCYYNQLLNDITLKNIDIGVRLFEALKKDEFVLFYQPQIDLKTGSIVGAEALIRWVAEDGHIISPAEFIPIAEKNGSIQSMTHWVIRQSCKDCAIWHAKGYAGLFVSVNIPSMMLEDGNLPEIISDACHHAGINPRFLEIELTESVLLENGDYIQEQLQAIRDMGVSLAIDDFGTGYSNLSYLSRLNVQKLKVDQYFVMNLLKSKQDRTIVQAIAQIAHSFGMKTVAEGVEESELIGPLRDLHCTIGQGYLWSKPVPFHEFIKLLTPVMPIYSVLR